MIEVTMISTLPPVVGLSPYTRGLVQELSKILKVNFLGFNHIYPKFLFPGELKDKTAPLLTESENLNISNTLNWYNPVGWIIEAFKIKSPLIHAQWWSYPLATIYITILGINKIRGKKVVLTIHNVSPHEKSLLKTLLNKSVFFLGDEYIVHTQNNQDVLRKIVGGKKKIHIIPHGMLQNRLTGISKQKAREYLGISETDRILLCFGHIRDYKGLDTALKALALINDKNIKLIIAGKCWEDWNKYAQIIKGLNLKDRVICKIGFIPTDKIECFFAASDLVLSPYKHFESQSGVGALVLSYGIPLIVSSVGGLPDYVIDPSCIVTPDHPDELSEKILKILNDEILYEKLKHDINITKLKFSWEEIAKNTKNVYASLL